MSSIQRTSPLAISAFTVSGIAIGLLLQLMRSARGQSPLVPPLSLSLTVLVLAMVLLVLAISLRRAVTRKSGKRVNPFLAVRLLAGAKAGQFVGAMTGGFGGGLLLQLLSRSVMPPATTWVPMIIVVGSGIALFICAAIAESLCRVPPDDTSEGGDARRSATGTDPEPSTA